MDLPIESFLYFILFMILKYMYENILDITIALSCGWVFNYTRFDYILFVTSYLLAMNILHNGL